MEIYKVVEWSDELSVGIQEIDEQHKYLVGLVNELNEALITRGGTDAVRETFDRLIEYTRTHFVVEESLMRILGYPDYENHKHSHEQLLGQVLAFKERFETEHRVHRRELMEFLKQWLTQHIMKEDVLYSEHFLRRGVHSSWLKPGWLKRFW